jgi:hypothetical protein
MAASPGPERERNNSSIRCPIVVHRWFREGEGWAFSNFGLLSQPETRSLILQLLGRVIQQGRQMLHNGQQNMVEDSICPKELKGQGIVYHLRKDTAPSDRNAIDRHPTVLVAAILPIRPPDKSLRRILDLLRSQPIPDHAGPDNQLGLSIPQSLVPAPAQVTSSIFRQVWKYVRILIVVAGLMLIILMLIINWLMPSNEITPNAVHDRLLRPLGVEIPKGNDFDSKVLEAFVKLYCQRGMINHYLPGLPDSLSEKLDRLARANPGLFDTRQTEALHPDVQFLKYCQNLLDEIKCLPGESVNIPPWRTVRSQLAKVVNEVAGVVRQNRPEESRKITGSKGIDILEDWVVNRLTQKQIHPVSWDTWFATRFTWRHGEQFPWDKYHKDASAIVLSCLRQDKTEYPRDVQEAAQEMFGWLRRWNVQGVTQEDVEIRPGFVGRCFVEFLSIKHVSPETRLNLDREGSLVWQKLRNLPENGWEEIHLVKTWLSKPKATSKNEEDRVLTRRELWKAVEQSVDQLLDKLKLEKTGSTAAKVQRIGNAVKEWESAIRDEMNLRDSIHKLEQRKAYLGKELEKMENTRRHLDQQWEKLKDVKPDDPRYSQTESVCSERRKVYEQLKKLKMELESVERKLEEMKRRVQSEKREHLGIEEMRPFESSMVKEVNELWKRLVQKGSEKE